MAEKLQWLQRHDKECGGLYGLLPLCVGMPVRATEHLDRRRGILKGCRGCRGTIVGWSSCADETHDGVVLWNALPQAVYVKFDTAECWQIDGVPEENVYPVATCKRVWYLDRQRKNPQLRVSRTQFPLAPAFAITAHVAQGQTITEGVLTDLCVGLGGNPFTAYVAFTRVQGRTRLFIYRAFDAAPFQKGIGLGRDLLLRQLRGERIEWKALLKNGRVVPARSASRPLHSPQDSGNAAMLTACVVSARRGTRMPGRRGNATSANGGMQRRTFRTSIGNDNAAFTACV